MIKDNICEICQEELFEGNNKEDETIIYNEWLEVNRNCSVCNKKGCYECLQVCYTCCSAADLDTFLPICFYCNKNQRYKELECGCEWKVCKYHENDGCDQCHANYNFQSKMNGY